MNSALAKISKGVTFTNRINIQRKKDTAPQTDGKKIATEAKTL